ncbi:MAG: hypothetical protein JNJ55_11425 [Betaproteobacteria bacterium]|nr:hypothetical protein [Betaproteobacteria bacterium]
MVKNTGILTVAALIALTGCGKKEEARHTPEQAKAEKDAATKAVRDNPVYGDQFKAMDKAKATADEAAKKTEDVLKKAEEAK